MLTHSGVFCLRTNQLDWDAQILWRTYSMLTDVERAFRVLKASRLEIRPVRVYSEDHVRAHVFLCVLAYYAERHLRRRLAPLLFEDDDREGARAQRKSPVAPARVSERARIKAAAKLTSDGLPFHSFTTLLADLATLMLNEVAIPARQAYRFPLLSEPTPLQSRAFEQMGIDPTKLVPSTSPA